MQFKTTQELQVYIEKLYEKVKTVAEQEGIYEPLSVYFTNNPKKVNFREGVYCYSDEKGYHKYTYERGEKLGVITTDNLFEISYSALYSQIFLLAVNYESKNNIAGQDFRRVMFRKRLELWREIGEEYYERAKKEIEEVLKNNPYDDEAQKRLEEILASRQRN